MDVSGLRRVHSDSELFTEMPGGTRQPFSICEKMEIHFEATAAEDLRVRTFQR
jgi:hypothetical protein